MNDDELLAGLLRKMINANTETYVGYLNFGEGHQGNYLTIDMTIPVSADEIAALNRACE